MPSLNERLWNTAIGAGPGPRRSVAWVGGAFIAAVVGLSIADGMRGYEATVDTTTRELEAQARVIAEQTARSLQATDVVLRHLVQQWRSGALPALSRTELHRYLAQQSVGLVQIDGLVVFEADGSVRGVSLVPPEGQAPINVAGMPIFKRLRDDRDAGLAIEGAMRSPGDNTWIFPIWRRLETPEGAFAGAVGARGRIEYFQAFYRDALADPHTRIALLHRNGALIARHPPLESSLGRQLPQVQELLAAAVAGQLPTRAVSPLDGVERFGAARPVPDYPLVVVVSRDVSAALAPWRAQALRAGLNTLALATLAALLLAVVMRQLARLDRARASLEVSQERYALAAAGSDDGIWDWDLQAGTAYESRRARELQGLPLQPETQPLAELQASLRYHPDDAQARTSAMQAHLDGRTPAYEVEYRIRHADGEYRWIHVRALCIRDSGGRPLRLAGSVSDVDSRKRAEVALRESEDRFAVAVAGSDDGIWVWNYETGRAYASKRAREIVGMPQASEDQSIGAWFAELEQRLHPDDLSRRRHALDEHLAGRAPAYEVELRVRKPDGGHRWIRAHGMCVRDAAGKPQRIAGSVSDIDARKRTEEALRRSEERYQLAVDGANEGLWDWDIESDMLFFSARAQQIVQLEPGEPLRPRREWFERSVYHPDDIAPVRAALVDHLRGVKPHYSVEYRMRQRDGAWGWYRQRGVALRHPDGRAYRMAGSIEDISVRKYAEAERERLETQLRQAQKLEAIGTLAGGIAHDFNNILSAILGYGELVQKDAGDGTALRRHIDASMSAAMRAKSLVERILAFSRGGIGARVPVHVQSVVDEALDGIAAALPAGVTLARRMQAHDAGVLGDATQIHQVVMNLCANAVHAMRSEGTLTVAVDDVTLPAARPVATSTLPAGRYVCLAVTDTGTGIAPAVLERIFDPFFTTKEVGVGTGLGLSLVHGIVTDLGGGIAVDSRPGQGTTFAVHLPWHSYVAAPVAAEEHVVRGDGQAVLFVDDEEALVQLGEEMLAELGYEPVGFASSVAALAAFRAEPDRFDAVLSDESMPAMNGSELAVEIRRLRPGLPIVLMSGYVSPALVAAARQIGVVEVIAKPLVSRDIARSLAAALQHKEATSCST
jgi:PAS domain S-box-containing protein